MRAGSKSVLLAVDLDPKVPVGRCFIPESSASYIGTTAELEIAKEIPIIESLAVEFLNEQTPASKPNNKGLCSYLLKLLEGSLATSQEPVVVSLNGVHRAVRFTSTPKEGVVVSTTRISLGSDDSSSKPAVAGFRMVGGLDSVIQELVNTVKKPLLSGVEYARYGLKPPRGILLFGPPGTGKTLLVRALSQELPTTLVESVKGTDLSGPDSDSKIHALFASTRRKCLESGFSSVVIFIDEIDSLCPARDAGVGESERRAVAALLTEMDGFDAKTDSVPFAVIGATNRPNAIDIALRRPGRFERELEIPPPDIPGRAAILSILAEGQFSSIWRPTGDEITEIASVTHGFVGADLVSLISQSAFAAVEHGEDSLALRRIKDQLVHVKPSALRELAVSVPKTSWSDIGGYEVVKNQLIEAVIWPTRFADKFKRLSVDPPRGVLLYGPPGCSKTMMARAVATESSMNFVAVKGPEVFSKWVGESEQAIRDLFRKARQASPCVIFFDEIDAIASQREGGDGGVSNRVLTQLLTEMDGVSGLKQVVVIAATNRPHVLDPALLRPGRLDRIVYVGLPDEQARKSIWHAGLAKVPHMLADKDSEFTATLARLTDGYTGAEIVMAIKEAAILCIRQLVEKESRDLADQLESLSLRPSGNLEWAHVEAALQQVKPRTDSALLDVLTAFKNRSVIE